VLTPFDREPPEARVELVELDPVIDTESLQQVQRDAVQVAGDLGPAMARASRPTART
jgi:hypothetical protein